MPNKLELWYPVKPGTITQGFGPSPYPDLQRKYLDLGMLGHNGIDFLAPDGWLVRSAHDGEVTFSGQDGAGGETIVIRTTQKFAYREGESFFKTIYCHFRHGGILVKSGDLVKTGQVIGLADNTGFSTGSHLHFGLKPVIQGEADWQWFNIESTNGYIGAIDPAPYFNKYCAEDNVQVLSLLTRIRDLLYNFVKMVKLG